MQPRELELTRASRIVLILLVVQHLGLSQLLVAAPATGAGSHPAPSAWSVAPTDAVASPTAVVVPDIRTDTTIGQHGAQTISPDQAPLSRRLTRAPPAG
jgi:hypothetical protein